MITENITQVKADIATAAQDAGRKTPVRLIAVSKRKPLQAIKEAMSAGQIDFGENYLQEAVEKITSIDTEKALFHFIGPLQSNKTKLAVTHFDMIHTIDRIKIAKAVAKHAANLNKIQKVLIQINVGREKQKSGISPEDAETLLQQMQEFPSLNICGLMTIPPYGQTAEESRPYFTELHELGLRFKKEGLLAQSAPLELSMGMSSDYRVAIEEGATMIRVGTALFGSRD